MGGGTSTIETWAVNVFGFTGGMVICKTVTVPIGTMHINTSNDVKPRLERLGAAAIMLDIGRCRPSKIAPFFSISNIKFADTFGSFPEQVF